jgi:hypothetical protein
MRWKLPWEREKRDAPKKNPELVPGFGYSEIDHHWIFDLLSADDAYIEKRLNMDMTTFFPRDKTGSTLEDYLKPYIEAVENGKAEEWSQKEGITQSPERIRVSAAKRIVDFRKRHPKNS